MVANLRPKIIEMKHTMNTISVVISILVVSTCGPVVDCQQDISSIMSEDESDNEIRYFGFMDNLFDNSISFLQKMKSKYKWYMTREDVSIADHKSESGVGDEDEDRYLTIVGDGRQYERVVVNKSSDGGLTYHMIVDYVLQVCEYRSVDVLQEE